MKHFEIGYIITELAWYSFYAYCFKSLYANNGLKMAFDALMRKREKLNLDPGASMLWMKYGNPKCYLCPLSQQTDICSSICTSKEELS